jgi:isopentenyl-diphosphate delta-isomerase
MSAVSASRAVPPAVPPEYVVLLDDDGRPCGRARKDEVHTAATPLHLAFSCWLLDGDGKVLLTRRATAKRTWPGIWTNAFCGHPAPGEPVEDAVRRRGRQELGADVERLRPTFRYTATMADGTRENEVCPVFTAALAGPLRPDPAEVDGWRWVEPGALDELARAAPDELSPWLRLQLPLLLAGGLLAVPTG